MDLALHKMEGQHRHGTACFYSSSIPGDPDKETLCPEGN